MRGRRVVGHFACVACGKCCNGWLPLTIEDALRHADRFPLAMVWTPVRPGTPSFNLTSKLFVTCRTDRGETVALRIVPTSYIPPSMQCPELNADGRCAVHPIKPLRCRTMPFFPFREERDQDAMLEPRPEWICDVSEEAPLVYEKGRILDRTDFDQELAVIRKEAPLIRNYARPILASSKQMVAIVSRTSLVAGGNIVLSFGSLLKGLGTDSRTVARKQIDVLRRFEEKTRLDPQAAAYCRRYREWIAELTSLAG